MTQPALTNALSVPEAITTRRSIRKYKDQPVPQHDLETILDLAGRAPSAWNIQPWRFVVVRNPEVKEQLKAAAYGQGQVSAAPVVIVLYSDMEAALGNLDAVLHPGIPADQRESSISGILRAFEPQAVEQREAWGAGQSYIALGYLSLAARSLGYDTSLMLGFNPAQVKQILGLPENASVPALIALGVADEEGFSQHRHPVEAVATFVN